MAEITPMMRARDRTMRCGVQGRTRCEAHNTGGACDRSDERAEFEAELARGDHDT